MRKRTGGGVAVGMEATQKEQGAFSADCGLCECETFFFHMKKCNRRAQTQ